MKRLLQACLLLVLGGALLGCGPPRKSVFPPDVTIQQLLVSPTGQWQLTVRIQNNSYGEMQFTALEGSLQIAQQIPVRLHAAFKRDIPPLSGDVIALQLLPTTAMASALQAMDVKGSAGSLKYRVSGSATALPEQERKPRNFDFAGNGWLSPVPGIAHTYR